MTSIGQSEPDPNVNKKHAEAAAGLPERVIVIGSGFGGAATACRLAQAGFEVLLLERGRRYEAHDFPALPVDENLLPDFHRWTWQHDQGLWELRDLGELVSAQAAGYGGGSLIYANVHLRAPARVFDDRWPGCYQAKNGKEGGELLRPFYDMAASMLDVAPITEHTQLSKGLVKADQLRRAAAELKREHQFFFPPLAISRKDGVNAHGREQGKCIGCAACSSGCPVRAKNTLDHNYLAVAERHGLKVKTRFEVRRIEQRAQDRWFVHGFDHDTQRCRRYEAPVVFLCAGALRSTELLARARLLPRSRAVKKFVGVGYFPGGDALAMVYDTEHAQEPSVGPTITTTLVHNHPSDEKSFFLIQDGGYAHELSRLTGLLRAPLWIGRNRVRNAGKATIAASTTQERDRKLIKRLELGQITPSALDDLLGAISDGSFAAVASDDVRSQWTTFLGDLKRPLLLDAVVDRTIDSALRIRIEAFCGKLGLKPHHWPVRLILHVARTCTRWMVRLTLGGTSNLSDRAIRALLEGGGLTHAKLAENVLGYSGERPVHRTMLLAMGRDAAQGELKLHRGRLVADLDLFTLAPGYAMQEQLMSDLAKQLGGELRVNPAFSFLGKPITVHNQGGCRMSDSPKLGVTAPDGSVYGCNGLYIADGSLLCTSVGVNPSATILAIAERNVLKFIHKYKKNWPENDASPGADAYRTQLSAARDWAQRATGWQLKPPSGASPEFKSEPLGLKFNESMQGYYTPTDQLPGTDIARYKMFETKGRPDFPIHAKLTVTVRNLAGLFEDPHHTMEVGGTVELRLPHDEKGTKRTLDIVDPSSLELFADPGKPYSMWRRSQARNIAQVFATRPSRPRQRAQRGEERTLDYVLSCEDSKTREPWLLSGIKLIRNDPGPDAWRATSSLYVCLWGIGPDGKHDKDHPLVLHGVGVIHVELSEFLNTQLPSIEPIPKEDPRGIWARAAFASFFFGSLQRIYLPGASKTYDTLLNPRFKQPRGGR